MFEVYRSRGQKASTTAQVGTVAPPLQRRLSLLRQVDRDASGTGAELSGRLHAAAGRPHPRRAQLVALHHSLDEGPAAGADLGCPYVDEARLPDRQSRHPTWTHGGLVDRVLSGVTRAELVRHGFPVFGRPPLQVLPQMSDDNVRRAARAEVLGYGRWAARRPWVWLDPAVADLGLTSMARCRHTSATGQLLTKSQAVETVSGPVRLRDELRARRRGEDVTSPRVRRALVAWRDARRTVAAARGPVR